MFVSITEKHLTLSDFLDREKRMVIAFHTEATRFDLFPDPRSNLTTELVALVGPEGGWSDNEIAFFKKNKIPLLSFGKHILRAETASIAVSALLLL